MMCDTGCPMCHDGILLRTEGRLDQSGDSYLPTAVWTCPRCGYSRFEPALHARWQSAVEAAGQTRLEVDRDEEQAPDLPRRAA